MHKILSCCFFCLDAMFVTFLTILVGISFLIFWFLVICPLSQHSIQSKRIVGRYLVKCPCQVNWKAFVWDCLATSSVFRAQCCALSSAFIFVFGKHKWLHFQSCFLSLLSVELFVLHIDSPVKSVGQSLHENIVISVSSRGSSYLAELLFRALCR